MGNGYVGKILWVDLTRSKLDPRDFPSEYKEYIGGLGVGTKILWDHLPENADPYGPENILIFMTGPLTGNTIMCGRHTTLAKSPLTGMIGHSSCGGFFGAQLKRAGFDGIVVQGRSSSSVYLVINGGSAELKDAKDLAGKGTYAVAKILKEKYPNGKLVMIGQAGERGVRFASIVDGDERNAGRTGMGAVMGAKNLKAIVAIGNLTVEVAKPEVLKEKEKWHIDQTQNNLMKKAMVDNYKKFGTSALFGISHLMRNLGIKNWDLRYWLDHVKISGQELRKKFFEKQYYCQRCIIGCGRVIRYKGELVHGPEYETMGALGTLCLNPSLENIVEINYRCNDYGMDTISTGGCLAFIMECSEKGLIDEKIEWGDGKKMLELVDLIARREEGLGNTLSNGTRKAAEIIGKGSEEFAMQCKGLEIPLHDPRTGMDIAYSTTSRGADHLQGQTLTKLLGSKDLELTMTSSNAQYIKVNQDYNVFIDSLCTCKFGLAPQGFLEPNDLLELYDLVTGQQLAINNALDVGEKTFNLLRLLAIREAGDLGKLDRIQDRFTKKNKHYEEEIAQYYRRRFWNPNGVPSKMIIRKFKINVPDSLKKYF